LALMGFGRFGHEMYTHYAFLGVSRDLHFLHVQTIGQVMYITLTYFRKRTEHNEHKKFFKRKKNGENNEKPSEIYEWTYIKRTMQKTLARTKAFVFHPLPSEV
jgi:hypothetical protein